MQTLADWYEDVRQLPRSTVLTLVKMGGKVSRLVAGKGTTKKKNKG